MGTRLKLSSAPLITIIMNHWAIISLCRSFHDISPNGIYVAPLQIFLLIHSWIDAMEKKKAWKFEVVTPFRNSDFIFKLGGIA